MQKLKPEKNRKKAYENMQNKMDNNITKEKKKKPKKKMAAHRLAKTQSERLAKKK
ncbi:hypothetical protein [Pasteurella multocida]|uniref:hypothetical protein n=1 Tax=Pasteurella multocida TaxID=747 RepID=UPI00145BCCFF|nr:hypothetical protein [Pasteurella multocida]NMK16502.1 hypothetical protein [Pasteurella multocida]